MTKKNCIFESGKGEIQLIRFFEEYIYRPIANFGLKISAIVGKLQNNCLDSYLLYVFLTVIVVIVFLGWFA